MSNNVNNSLKERVVENQRTLKRDVEISKVVESGGEGADPDAQNLIMLQKRQLVNSVTYLLKS